MNKKRIQLGRLELVAFISGFVLMVFELAGARILAPSIGSSTYVWTSVIGVIIAALSLGYWAGGKVADRRGHSVDIARLCLAVALTIAYALVTYFGTLQWVAAGFDDPRLQGVVASLLLFAPTSFVLGMLSPYLAKLNVRSLETSGSAVASLSALNSLGGITGTFIAGFILFGYVGSRETLALLVVAMIGLSWLVGPRVQWRARAAMSIAVAIVVMIPQPMVYGKHIDTPSAGYTVIEGVDRQYGMIRGLATGPEAVQSGIYPQKPDELVFWYTRQMDAIVASTSQRQDILVLGGGAFTLPQHLAKKYPASAIDVVEIDAKLADIARQHFNYQDPPNVRLFFEDARTYVNRAHKQYDIILIDVYGDAHVPFSMITRQYGNRIAALLKPSGVVAANMIAGMQGECLVLLNALDAPYRMHLPFVQYTQQDTSRAYSNMITTYSRTPHTYEAMQPLNLKSLVVYSDNRAPAELLQHDCRRSQPSN